MKNVVLTILSFLALNLSHSQDTLFSENVGKLFELRVDSIEKETTIYRYGPSTFFNLHFTIKNISQDTLIFITNSCFYYNHYLLKTKNLEIDINSSGGCNVNSLTYHELIPGQEVQIKQDISAINLDSIEFGFERIFLSIPIVKDNQIKFRVDGRNFVKNSKPLIYQGNTKIVKTIICKNKRRCRKLHLTQ